MAALHRHVRDELLQVIVGDVLERGERVPAVLVEGGSVRGQVVGYEEGGGGLRHLRAGTRDQPTVKLEACAEHKADRGQDAAGRGTCCIGAVYFSV